MTGKASVVDVRAASKLHPTAILVSAKADRTTTATRLTAVPVTHMLALGKPSGSLMSGARPGCHDMEALPA
eukprot:3299088-Alexandrium_andersonii.AAC.1